MMDSASSRLVDRHEIPISACDDTDYHLFSDKEMFSFTQQREYRLALDVDVRRVVEVEVNDSSVPRYCARKGSGSRSQTRDNVEAGEIGNNEVGFILQLFWLEAIL
jgi:hypothetical protein